MMVSKKAVLFLGASALVQCVAAQSISDGAGETQQPAAEAALPNHAEESQAPVKRSALWTAVRTQQRENPAESAKEERRLTPAERQELRNQVRRAAGQSEASDMKVGVPLALPHLLSIRR